MNIVARGASELSMRKLNTFMRSLYSFLADPAGHVTKAWATIKTTIPKTATERDDVRDAIVVFDNLSEAVASFLKTKGETDEEKPTP